jgi:hypothetical protein
MKEKEKYNINDFWPQADEMLKKHFRQKRLFRLLGASIFTVAVAIGFFTLSNKNENKNIHSLNSSKKNNSTVSDLNSTTRVILIPISLMKLQQQKIKTQLMLK